jgi:hypothetical protein
MANTRDSIREQFGLIDRGSHARSNDVTVEKRGLNPEESKVKIRPEPPKPIITNQTTPESSSGD